MLFKGTLIHSPFSCTMCFIIVFINEHDDDDDDVFLDSRPNTLCTMSTFIFNPHIEVTFATFSIVYSQIVQV